jgi:hypothetical protein
MWKKYAEMFCKKGLSGRFCVTAAEEMSREFPEMSASEFMDKTGFSKKYGESGIHSLISGLEDPGFYEAIAKLKKA